MKIEKKLIKYNFVKGRSGNKIKYIVIHDTGNTAKGSNADNHFKYFNGGNRSASAHYFVDDEKILQIIEDGDTAWHVGDGKGLKGITNSNSIGIEICVNSDGNYDVAVLKTLELVKYLMDIYGITVYNVVRHYDASGKICPRSMHSNNWAKWNDFKSKLVSKNYLNLTINGVMRKVNGVNKDGTTYLIIDGDEIPVRILGESLGFKVGWNDNIKSVLWND